MTTWTRWSWRYRIGALFALMMLLQGSACPNAIPYNLPTYPVPGVGDVVPEKYCESRAYVGCYYRVRVNVKDVTGDPRNDYYTHRTVTEGSREYQIIEEYFRTHRDLPVVGFDRPGIPGAASLPPLPPAQ